MTGIQYRPSIDGMRALAVAAVLVFHLDESFLPGGFVGVDVFFVISGYLITSIIYDDSRSGKLSLSRFYQRRISRIFPVFFVVAFAILLAAAIFYTSQDFASAGALATASALSVTNLKLMLQGNYFDVSPDSQPFLHFWSLSVEEQFYLFLPLLMMISQRLKLSRRWLLLVLCMLAVVSFLSCVLLTNVRPSWAFYLLPTRAWELLAGSILAVSTYRSSSFESNGRFDWTVVGLCLIVLSFVFVNGSLPFPGFVALLPVMGTLMLLGDSTGNDGVGNRMLSHRWMIFVGRLSYSLYLWHWPVYCFVDYRLFDQPPLIRLGLKVLLTFAFSLSSYLVIEKPLRIYLNKPSRKLFVFVAFAAGVAMFALAGISIRNEQYVDSSVRDALRGGVHFSNASGGGRVVLVGDSNGSMYGAMMKSLAARLDLNLNVLSVAAGDPLPGTELYNRSLRFLAEVKPDVTIFAAAWGGKLRNNRERLDVAIDAMLKHSSYVILVTQPPILPETASRHYFRENGYQAVVEDPVVAEQRKGMNEFLLSFRSRRVKVIETDEYFINEKGEIVFADMFGRQLFQDRAHLSGQGARLIETSLSKVIVELLEAETHGKNDVSGVGDGVGG